MNKLLLFHNFSFFPLWSVLLTCLSIFAFNFSLLCYIFCLHLISSPSFAESCCLRVVPLSKNRKTSTAIYKLYYSFWPMSWLSVVKCNYSTVYIFPSISEYMQCIYHVQNKYYTYTKEYLCGVGGTMCIAVACMCILGLKDFFNGVFSSLLCLIILENNWL